MARAQSSPRADARLDTALTGDLHPWAGVRGRQLRGHGRRRRGRQEVDEEGKEEEEEGDEEEDEEVWTTQEWGSTDVYSIVVNKVLAFFDLQ